MIRLAVRTFTDRWQLFVGTGIAVTVGVAIVHAGLTIILGVENADVPSGVSPADAEAFAQAASGASTLTGMTVMLGAFLTVFVVGSTFAFAVDQRRPDLAILRLGGVTARQLRGLLLAEALLTALAGTVAGALLGTALTGVQGTMLSWLGALPPELETPMRPAVLVVDLAIAVAVSVAGAWGAARRATKIAPLDGLRRSIDEQRVMTASRWIGAAVAIALTAVQAYFSATVGGMLIPLLLGLGIVMTASVAMSRLAPLLVPAVARVLTPWARRSPVAEVAVANLRDATRRTAACAAPMIVLVSLVMGLQGILDTQGKAISSEVTQLLRADLIATGGEIDLAAVSSTRGVALAAPETVVPLAIQLVSGGVTTTGLGTVVAVEPDAFRATHLQRPEAGDLSSFGPESIVFGPGLDRTMIGATYDEVVLNLDDGTPIPLREAARMGETLAGSDGFYIDRALLPAEALERQTRILVQLEPGAAPLSVERSLRAAGVEEVQTLAEFSAEQDQASERENRAVMAAIVGLGSLYALVSVLSTLAISISQRRREFATLRLNGLTRRHVQRAVIIESLAATGIGLLLGALAAVLALVGLWVATARIYGAPVIAIPWTLLGSITLLAAMLTILTAVLTTRRGLSAPAIQALGGQE